MSSFIPPGTEIGSYRIESAIDRGGMALVYEDTDLRLRQCGAMKVLSTERPPLLGHHGQAG